MNTTHLIHIAGLDTTVPCAEGQIGKTDPTARRHFNAKVVLSEPDDGWIGRTGFVHHAVLQDHDTLADHQAHAFGAPALVD